MLPLGMGQPVKIADDLVLDARMMGKLGHRSIAGQIEFWARLGEALEPLLQGVQAVALLKDPKACSEMKKEFTEVRIKLGDAGASRRAAEAVLNAL